MGRTVAVIVHASISIVAAGLYFFFVVPRWYELMGDTPQTLGLVLRIVTGVLIGLAALPVVFTWTRTKRPELATPQLALRLRATSISLHVLAAVLIVGTAVAEIWMSLDRFGPWLFGIYGAAAAIALLGIFGFYLAFVAELPPPPPKPLKTKDKVNRRTRKQADAEAEAAEEAETVDEAQETEEVEESEASTKVSLTKEPSQEEAADETAADESDEADESKADSETETEPEADKSLHNKRPSSKSGTKRRGWRSRGEVTAED
ncbi:hypothetical protein A5740_27115 [Mycobacterium sp. GA-1841]|uniref:hypothetical protein n=1 Tax=Mycobacterium sp. GA-1841 TaxID=1834154 RepID=UPI00096C7588|nr:hypothetical protein [Mycobacterium sp. GA-1841]OMC38428.1 hypothetical protein A5740_27115 [Mycobacterium sp. GA-1841]